MGTFTEKFNMNRSMQIAVLLGLLSVVLVMAVPVTDMTDEVADDSEAVQATEDSLEIGEETTESGGWGKKNSRRRRRRWLKQIQTPVGSGRRGLATAKRIARISMRSAKSSATIRNWWPQPRQRQRASSTLKLRAPVKASGRSCRS